MPLPVPAPVPHPGRGRGAEAHVHAGARPPVRTWRRTTGTSRTWPRTGRSRMAWRTSPGCWPWSRRSSPTTSTRSTSPPSTRWSGFPAAKRIAVQHHHAHVASCAAEHGVTGRFLGVAYDGLGMGDDGTLWGGEVFDADLRGYRRIAPVRACPAARRRPRREAPVPHGARLPARRRGRSATAHPGMAAGRRREDLADPGHPAAAFLARLDPRETALVRQQVARRLNAPVASSAGRLFDAAAALIGIRDVAEYEAHAAIDLELAAGERIAPPLPYRLERLDGLVVYDPRPTLAALLEGDAGRTLEGRARGRVPGHDRGGDAGDPPRRARFDRDRYRVPLGRRVPEPPARVGRCCGTSPGTGSGCSSTARFPSTTGA